MDKKERQRVPPGERNWGGRRKQILIRYADRPCRVTFKVLGELLHENPKNLYEKWNKRGRPERVKNASFFDRRPTRKPSTKTIKQREDALKKANQRKKELQAKRDAQRLKPRSFRNEGNDEWRALSDAPRQKGIITK